jgi:penicillin-binding protein 2
VSHHPNEVLRRARIARTVLMLSFLSLGTAFFRTQVVQNAEYVLQSETNRLRAVPIPGARGIIYDRNNQIIAENLPGYSVSILVPNEDSLKSALKALNKVIEIDSTQQQRALRGFRAAKTRPAVIFNDASFQVVSVLQERRVEFPGLIIQSAPKRYYPDGEAMAPLVGYVGLISEKELEKEKFADYQPGQQVGKAGLELQYEEKLRGTEGRRYVEVDAKNRVVRDNAVRPDEPAISPEPLHTYLDIDLQRYAHEYFGDSLRGAMVALDPQTGGVLALYSAPTYDANRFTGGVPASYYNALTEDPFKPLFNRATMGQYAPASTFKLATAVLGLQLGLVDMDTRMPQPCTGSYYFGRVFKCWDHKGHGNVTLAQAIAKSCDVYFYQLGLRMSLSKLLAGGVALGFSKKSGIDLPYEQTPVWPESQSYFTKKYGARGWSTSVVLSLSIGQANNAQTPLTMAKFYTALATDGAAATPRIVADTTDKKLDRKQILNLPPEKLEALREALADVVSRGTAAGAQIQGLSIAGKTGTAQNPPNPDNAWFVGYAPVDKPQIVVAILIEEGLHGSAAARVATKMMERYLKKPLKLNTVLNDG